MKFVAVLVAATLLLPISGVAHAASTPPTQVSVGSLTVATNAAGGLFASAVSPNYLLRIQCVKKRCWVLAPNNGLGSKWRALPRKTVKVSLLPISVDELGRSTEQARIKLLVRKGGKVACVATATQGFALAPAKAVRVPGKAPKRVGSALKGWRASVAVGPASKVSGCPVVRR